MKALNDEREARRKTRDEERELKLMNESYSDFVLQGRFERSPTTAHRFALAMRHKGNTFGRSVAQIIVDLERQLPDYWTSEK